MIADRPELVGLYLPAGVHWLRPVGRDGRPMRLPDHWGMADRVWRNRALFLIQPGAAHTDQALDLVVSPDLSRWRWKDRTELEDAVARAIFSTETARAVVVEGERVIQPIEQRQAPFGEGWERWRPNPRWSLPSLEEGWDSPEESV